MFINTATELIEDSFRELSESDIREERWLTLSRHEPPVEMKNAFKRGLQVLADAFPKEDKVACYI